MALAALIDLHMRDDVCLACSLIARLEFKH
jgi:hypothetical protein